MIIKTALGFEITVTTPENMEALHMMFIIYNTKYQKRFLWCSLINHDYHFIIKDLAEELEGQFECLEEITEKYITFSIPIKKEFENNRNITYKTRFIDSVRFMARAVSQILLITSQRYISLF